MKFANLSMVTAATSALLQAGAQLFAIVVIVNTVTAAPPRSLAMYAGPYAYNSGPFWEVMPTVTLVLILVALAGNWRTPRRRLLLASVALFIAAGLFTVLVMGPVQDAVVSVGYNDTVNDSLRTQAARWRLLDWAGWVLTLGSGLLLISAMVVRVPAATISAR